ncbi:MAG TPA: hypothetical protein DD412_05185 [Holosporales bacterium]|nr:hypothetical protein [Holosporales bacterium]
MNWGKKKISAVSSFLIGTFMMAAGSISEAQEIDVDVKESFSEKCGVVETRGQLYECTVFTSNKESDFQAEIWDTAIQDKEVYNAVAKEYLDILDLKECRESRSAGLDIIFDSIYSDEITAQELLSGELLDRARTYFSSGKTCLSKTAGIYGNHELLKEIADKYSDLSDKMGQATDRLPVPKPQS